MEEVLEISSDSDTTILFCTNNDHIMNPLKEKNIYELNSSDEETTCMKVTQIENAKQFDKDLIEKLYKKYIPSSGIKLANGSNEASTSFTSLSNSGSNKSIDLTDSPAREDINDFNESYEVIQTEKSTYTPDLNPRKRELEMLSSDSSDEELGSGDEAKDQFTSEQEVMLGNIMKNKNSRKSSKSSKKVTGEKKDVQNAKTQKLLEKAEKKQQLERAKALKAATKNMQKSLRPEECLKNIIVTIDQDISQQLYGDNIKDYLRKNQISFKSLPRSNGLISWVRKLQTLTNMICKETEEEEKYYLTIISAKEFGKLTKTKSLGSYLISIKENCHFQHLTVVVHGKDTPNADEELAIMEINMSYKCNFQFAKKPDDLGFIVFMTTKSVAQIPYKLAKEEKYELQNEFFNDCNRDSVRVDKTGNGLGRLWHQMLTMFPLARLETAEAITAAYPTPTSLFKAYEYCSMKGEELIQDLPIRRAYGPLASVRKIGPELSKKCHNFFTAEENILL